MIFWRFWLSSIESLFFKGLRGFLGGMWWFFVMWKVVKCLILLGLLEAGIEVVFWIGLMWNVSEMPILQGVCGLNRYAGLPVEQTFLKCKLCPYLYRTNVLNYTIIVQYYSIFIVSSKTLYALQWASVVIYRTAIYNYAGLLQL